MKNSRKLKHGEFFWIDKAVIREYVPKIGAVGLTVYTFLASYADSRQKCFPSQKYIARHLGCSRSTVWRALEKLERHGLINKEQMPGRRNCEYLLLKVERCFPGEKNLSHGRALPVSEAGTNDNKLIIIKNDKGNKFLNRKILDS